jgi:hypothetical protein
MGRPLHPCSLPCVIACAILSAFSPTALAQPTPDAKPDATPASSPAQSPERRPALAKVVSDATAPILPHASGAVVIGAALESDTPAPRGPALVQRIVSLLAGAIGPAARAVRNPMTLEQARAEAASSPALAYVQTQIADGELRITIDVYPIPRNIWDRSRSGAPGPAGHGFGTARIDAEVRAFLAPVALVARNPLRIPLPSPEVVALGCDDIDEDGALEVLLVSRRTVATGRIRQGRFVPSHEVGWQNLAPIAPAPWREPLGTLASTPGSLWVGLTDRAHSVRLDSRLASIANFDGMPLPIPGGVACAQRRVGSLTAELAPCLPNSPAPPFQATFPFDAAAATQTIDKEGVLRSTWATRNPTDGTVNLLDDRGTQHALQNVGAQIALADVDLDGDPDLIASKNVLAPRNDAVVVRSWRKNGTVDKRLELAVPDGISAIAVCPPDGPNQRTMLVATSKELWILR